MKRPPAVAPQKEAKLDYGGSRLLRTKREVAIWRGHSRQRQWTEKDGVPTLRKREDRFASPLCRT